MKSGSKLLFSVFFLLAGARLAAAHRVLGAGLESGLTHPFFGFDHLLAMVAVGVISTQVGGKGIWVVPSAFVFSMVFGGVLAIAGISLPAVDVAIAVSVLVLGIIIAFSKKISIKWAVACVSLFALFHGHAHGEELPAIANPLLYTVGFVFSTTALHITGVLVGNFSKKTVFSMKTLRIVGALASIAGLFFLAAA